MWYLTEGKASVLWSDLGSLSSEVGGGDTPARNLWHIGSLRWGRRELEVVELGSGSGKYAALWWLQPTGTSSHWAMVPPRVTAKPLVSGLRNLCVGVLKGSVDMCVQECGPELGGVWVSCGGSRVHMSLSLMLTHVRFLTTRISFHLPNSRNPYVSNVKEAMEIQRDNRSESAQHTSSQTAITGCARSTDVGLRR